MKMPAKYYGQYNLHATKRRICIYHIGIRLYNNGHFRRETVMTAPLTNISE